jgi:hypothetical protein
VIYLDTSAAAKLIQAEAESSALAVFLAERLNTPLVSSVLLYPELIRVVARRRPALVPRAVVGAVREARGSPVPEMTSMAALPTAGKASGNVLLVGGRHICSCSLANNSYRAKTLTGRRCAG